MSQKKPKCQIWQLTGNLVFGSSEFSELMIEFEEDPPHQVILVQPGEPYGCTKIRHKVIEVESSGGVTFILDITGAQYGFHDTVVPTIEYCRARKCRVVTRNSYTRESWDKYRVFEEFGYATGVKSLVQLLIDVEGISLLDQLLSRIVASADSRFNGHDNLLLGFQDFSEPSFRQLLDEFEMKAPQVCNIYYQWLQKPGNALIGTEGCLKFRKGIYEWNRFSFDSEPCSDEVTDVGQDQDSITE